MSSSASLTCYETRRIEAERLIALAMDMLDASRDQIAHDHMGLALSAMDHCREQERSAASAKG